MKDYLLQQGFTRVVTLRPSDCGMDTQEQTVYLCLWSYLPANLPAPDLAAIHPYYPASQRAYQAARQAVAEGEKRGLHLRQDTALRLKPIFAHLRGFSQGRNTLSYVAGLGSRFHVQVLFMQEKADAYDADMWEEAPHPLQCGACRRCVDACPTGGITEHGFVREHCLRNWMLSGKPIPEDMRAPMQNMLVGCDICQRCCPYNAALPVQEGEGIPIAEVLAQPKETTARLIPYLGANLALPNRILGQVLLCAGNQRDTSLLPLVEPLTKHPSPLVREHAVWAQEKLKT